MREVASCYFGSVICKFRQGMFNVRRDVIPGRVFLGGDRGCFPVLAGIVSRWDPAGSCQVMRIRNEFRS